jgi:hypothetical protein
MPSRSSAPSGTRSARARRSSGSLDRGAEARQFYEAAADVFARAAEPWLTASALAKLASALAADGRADRAQAQRDAALRLIEPYDDPRTVALRRELTDMTGA